MRKQCPNCGAALFEDYWDTVEEQDDGSFILNSFEALVCEGNCGYYFRLEREL